MRNSFLMCPPSLRMQPGLNFELPEPITSPFRLHQLELVLGKLKSYKIVHISKLINPPDNPIRWVLSSCPPYRQENRSSKRSDWPTVSWDSNPGAVLCFHVWQYAGLDNLKIHFL